MTKKYDDSEALVLLAEAAEKAAPDTKGRLAAAHELIEALVGLNTKFGFSFERSPNDELSVTMKEPGADTGRKVICSAATGTWTFYQDADQCSLPLTYERLTGRFVGPEETGEGGTKQRRSALGTIVSALLGQSSAVLYK